MPEPNRKVPRLAWDFTKELMKDNDFWVRSSGVWYGGVVITEGIVGAALLMSLPLAIQVAGIAGGAALVAAGAYGIYSGFVSSWRSMENICDRAFGKFNPPRGGRQRFHQFIDFMAQKSLVKKNRHPCFKSKT